MIVVGYSADRYGTAALEHGITEAKRRDTNLLVINATRGDALADPRFAQSDEVHDVEERLNRCGVEFELAQPVGVEAADELLKAMENDDAELLVVGIRHRSPVGKLLLGSGAQQVLLECPKPVLAVKPNEP
jgi:nucleotide-binding universal stress UspA family protein